MKNNSVRVVVSDFGGSHGDSVVAGIIWGYNLCHLEQIDITGQVLQVNGWLEAIQYAMLHPEVEMIVRSTTELSYKTIEEVKHLYPRVQVVFPLGSNSFLQLPKFKEPEPPLICVTGAGDNESRNNTAWGNGLEFWDRDYNWYQVGKDFSSFSNAVIAAKLLRTRDELNKKFEEREISWWETRYLLRLTAFKNEPNRETYPWDIHNGYGSPLVDWAVFTGGAEVPEDPYLQSTTLGEVGKITPEAHGAVTLRLGEVQNAERYVLFRNGEMLTKLSGDDPLVYTDILTYYGNYFYAYYATKGESRTAYSKEIAVKFDMGNKPVILDLGQPIKNEE